jgi:hypothetical protein
MPRPIPNRELRTGRLTIRVLPGAAARTNQLRPARPIHSREIPRPIARYLRPDRAAETTGQRLQALTGQRLRAVTGHPVLPDPVTGLPDPVTGPLQDPRDPSAAVRAA